ncbi:hypothetical protein VTG60DRAFT_1956 [Thermothelomyces hinnuleus]
MPLRCDTVPLRHDTCSVGQMLLVCKLACVPAFDGSLRPIDLLRVCNTVHGLSLTGRPVPDRLLSHSPRTPENPRMTSCVLSACYRGGDPALLLTRAIVDRWQWTETVGSLADKVRHVEAPYIESSQSAQCPAALYRAEKEVSQKGPSRNTRDHTSLTCELSGPQDH